MLRPLVAMAVLVASMAVVVIASATPASACADLTAPNLGRDGYYPADTYLQDFAVGPDDSILLGTFEPRRLSPQGDLLALYDYHPSLSDQVFGLADGGALIRRRGVFRYRADGSLNDGFPLVDDAIRWIGADDAGTFVYNKGVSSSDSFSPTLSIGRIHRHRPDGTPDNGFAGDGSTDEVLIARGDIGPYYTVHTIAMQPNDAGGVDLLVAWKNLGPGSALQFVRVDADGTVTEGAQSVPTDLVLLHVSEPLINGDRWEFLVTWTTVFNSTAVASSIVHLDTTTGAMSLHRDLPNLPKNYVTRADLARDSSGNLFVSVGGAYTVLSDTGRDPLLSAGVRGSWVALSESGSGIMGVDALSTGEFLLGLRESIAPSGVYALRGSAPPERFVVGGLTDQVLRLYRAVLGRDPDTAGLTYWAGLRARGASMTHLAWLFMEGDEFQARFGGLTNEAFVRQLYQFVLGREPDQPGLSHWVAQLDVGALDRATLLASFVDSPENIDRTNTIPPDPTEAELYRLYRATFLRSPDVDGHCYWSNERFAGLSLEEVATAFVSSPEFADRYGVLDDSGFVNLLYMNVLGRPADQAGLNHWVGLLQSGTPRGTILLGFSQSPEFSVLTNTTPR